MDKYGHSVCHYLVEWGGTNVSLNEVSGLNIIADVVQNHDSASPVHSPMKMPGMIHYSNIIFRRHIKKGDNEFYNWINTLKLNEVERRDIVISLLNSKHEPVTTWKVKNAFPIRYSGPALYSDCSEIAMEEIEIAHEGISVENK
ncbi:MAG: phage tail protein [Bacteroidales bacterium]|nr:phage tail protein [Bacteroidales bacterium]